MTDLPDAAELLAGILRLPLREIEHELAYAMRKKAVVGRRLARISWSQYFPTLKEILSEQQNHRCCWCGKRMDGAGPPQDRPTFEHVVPLSEGGADHPANLAIACLECNNTPITRAGYG